MLQYAHEMVDVVVKFATFFYIDIPVKHYSSIALFFLLFSMVSLIAFYIFKSIALYKMATKNGVKCAWLAFVPFANYYLIGKMTGKIRFMGFTFSNIGVLFGSCLAIYFVITVFIDIYAASGDFLRLLKFDEYESGIKVVKSNFFSFLSILSFLISIFTMIFLFAMSLGFFAKYDRHKANLYSIILCLVFFFSSMFELFIPVIAVLIFAVRKKEPFDITAYLKMRNETIQKMQQHYNEVDPFDEFNNNRGENSSGLHQDIFSDFNVSNDYTEHNNNEINNDNDSSINNNTQINTNNSQQNNRPNDDDDDLFN